MTADRPTTGPALVAALHRAFNERDREGMLACLADDVTWHVEGDHPLAGSYEGRQRLWDGYLSPLWESPARLEDRDIREHGEHVVAFMDAVHNFGEGERDWPSVEVLHVVDGEVTERWGFTSGQAEIDVMLTRGCAAALDPGAEVPAGTADGAP